MNGTELIKKTQFTNGVYDPREARELISSIIDGHINFYKLQHLMSWEADHTTSPEFRDRKIEELVAKKSELKEVLKQARQEGFNISVDGVFEVKLVKQ